MSLEVYIASERVSQSERQPGGHVDALNIDHRQCMSQRIKSYILGLSSQFCFVTFVPMMSNASAIHRMTTGSLSITNKSWIRTTPSLILLHQRKSKEQWNNGYAWSSLMPGYFRALEDIANIHRLSGIIDLDQERRREIFGRC